MEVVQNAIPIRSLQMCLSLDALAAQIRFQIVFCVTFNATNNNNVKTSDQNARHIQYPKTLYPDVTTAQNITIYTCLLHRWVFLERQKNSTTQRDRHLFGDWDDVPLFFLHLFWKPRHIYGYAFIITKATHADRLVLSGHKHLIWSLIINSVDSLPENKSDLPAAWALVFLFLGANQKWCIDTVHSYLFYLLVFFFLSLWKNFPLAGKTQQTTNHFERLQTD